MKGTSSVVLAVLAIVAVLWYLSGQERASLGVGAPAQRAPASAPTQFDTAEHESPSVRSGAMGPRRTVPSSYSGGLVAPIVEATLSVRVLRSDTGEVVPGERVAVRAENDEHAVRETGGSTGNLGDAALSDRTGQCRFIVPAGEPLRVMSMRAFGHKQEKHLLVEPLANGETREVSLVMPVFLTWVRVESTVDGSPLAGALVREVEGTQEVLTGPTGQAALWCTEWRQETVSIEAPGYGLILVKVGSGHEEPSNPLLVRLTRSGCLRGRVLDSEDNPIPNAQISVMANERDLNWTESLDPRDVRGFSFASSEDPFWSVQTDSFGAFALCRLPPSVPLQVTVSKDHLRLRVPEPVKLTPGEEKETVYRLGAGAVVQGRVTDESGKLVPLCELWLKVGARCQDFAGSQWTPERRLRSDRTGRFKIEHVPDGEWCVGPAPDSGYLPIPVAVQVRNGHSIGEILVEVRAGYFVGGHVLGPTGEPVPHLEVYGRNRSCKSDTDGAFRIGPFEAGMVTLYVVATDLVPLEPMQVQAGQEDIVLQLVVGGRIAGRLVTVGGQPTEGVVSINGSRDRMWFINVSPTGEFQLNGLEPGEYGIAARSFADDACFIKSVLIPGPGAVIAGMELELVPGGKLALYLPSDADHVSYRIRSGSCVLAHDTANEGVVFSPCLPVGEVTVELLAPGHEVLVSRRIVIRAGATLSVNL